MTETSNRSKVFIGAALAAGIALVASIVTLVPSQAASGNARIRHALPVTEVASATRIEVDAQGHVIRFFIDGQQLAMLDSIGLHVEEVTAVQ